MKILVLGKDSVLQESIKIAVEALGHQSTTVTDTEAAWDACRETPFKIVVCEYGIDGSESLELAVKIQKSLAGRFFSILALTPEQSHLTVLDALHAGADDVLTSPLDPHALEIKLLVASRFFTLREVANKAQTVIAANHKLSVLGQLATTIAHELNTPLGALGLALEGASKKFNDPERLEKKIAIGLRAVDNMQRIVSQVLHFARTKPNNQQQCRLDLVIEETLALLGPKLSHDGVHIETQVLEVPMVAAPASELQQILINFLTNARDAVLAEGSRGRTVRISTEIKGDMAILSVQDQGAGIPEEIKNQLFLPFFTTKGTDANAGSGTGLGLSVVKNLVDKYHGQLEIESEPGQDTIFRLAIPFK